MKREVLTATSERQNQFSFVSTATGAVYCHWAEVRSLRWLVPLPGHLLMSTTTSSRIYSRKLPARTFQAARCFCRFLGDKCNPLKSRAPNSSSRTWPPGLSSPLSTCSYGGSRSAEVALFITTRLEPRITWFTRAPGITGALAHREKSIIGPGYSRISGVPRRISGRKRKPVGAAIIDARRTRRAAQSINQTRSPWD